MASAASAMCRRRVKAVGRPFSDTDRLAYSGRSQRLAESGFRDDIHPAAEQRFQLQLQPCEIEQGPAWLERHEEVDVTARFVVAASDRAEDAQFARPMRRRGGSNRIPQLGNAIPKEHDPGKLRS